MLYWFYCAGESVEKSSVTLQVHKFTMPLAPPVKPANDRRLGLLLLEDPVARIVKTDGGRASKTSNTIHFLQRWVALMTQVNL
jgi:hypothetical protein